MLRRSAAILVLLAAAVPAAADENLLRLVPKQATFVWVVEKPRAVVDAVAAIPQLEAARQFPQVRALYETAGAKRFLKLLAHLEAELGAKWPELIDKVAGGGVALAFDVLKEPAPTLLVVRGTDASVSNKTLSLLVKLVEDDGQTKVIRSSRLGVDVIGLGNDLSLARVGPVVYVANKPEFLDAALALAMTNAPVDSVAANPTAAAARTAAGPDPLAWAWLDFATVKQTQKAKDFFDNTRKELFQTVAFGATADALRRSDYVAAGLTRTATGFRFALTLPAKRADLSKDLDFHVPPAGERGTLPLLEPPGVVYSQSFHLDLGNLWADRKSIVNPDVLKQIEKAEKEVSRFLPGSTLGTLLQQSGPYHRLVFAHTGENLYSVEPGQPIPIPAYVVNVRDPKFVESLDAILRGAALLAGNQMGGLKQSDVEIDGLKVNVYRINEKPTTAVADANGIRFNFAPCYAAVGESFVVAGSPGTLKALIPELKKPSVVGHPAVWRNKLYAAGGAAFLAAHPEPAITETILGQGVGLAEAKKQVAELTRWLATLGTAGVEIDHGSDAVTIAVEWKLK
jgi:hypothetical protein